VALRDPNGQAQGEGEICLTLEPRPTGLMQGYQADDGGVLPTAGPLYRTGDVAALDDDGYLTYVGRADDVFKASDYRISPFELESALIEHPAVAEAAVVPSPDPLRLAVPKAFLALAPGHAPDRATALSIFQHCRATLAPFKRIRRLEFAELPKTISGKIRRVELRRLQQEMRKDVIAFEEVGDYQVAFDAEQLEEQHGADAGAVASRRAVEQQGIGVATCDQSKKRPPVFGKLRQDYQVFVTRRRFGRWLGEPSIADRNMLPSDAPENIGGRRAQQ